MSLDDMFNRNDRSGIDVLDSHITRAHKSIGEFWQDKTYSSVDKLIRICYGVSAASWMSYAAYADNPVGVTLPLILGGLAGVNALRPDTAAERSSCADEMRADFLGLHKDTFKVFDLTLMILGSAAAATATCVLASGITSGDADSVLYGLKEFTYGNGLLGLVAGAYLSKSDFRDPPKRPKKKPVLERIKEKIIDLLPEPALKPQEIPINNYRLACSFRY